jgi:hypothetical protein
MRGHTLRTGIRWAGRRGRALAAGLLLLALFLRAMVPPGYMPDLSALGEGGLPLVICTGNVQKTLLVDKDGAPVKTSDAPSPGEIPCLFAALAALAGSLLLVAALLVTVRPARQLAYRPVSRITWPAYIRLPGDIPPRAPPSFV